MMMMKKINYCRNMCHQRTIRHQLYELLQLYNICPRDTKTLNELNDDDFENEDYTKSM